MVPSMTSSKDFLCSEFRESRQEQEFNEKAKRVDLKIEKVVSWELSWSHCREVASSIPFFAKALVEKGNITSLAFHAVEANKIRIFSRWN